MLRGLVEAITITPSDQEPTDRARQRHRRMIALPEGSAVRLEGSPARWLRGQDATYTEQEL